MDQKILQEISTSLKKLVELKKANLEFQTGEVFNFPNENKEVSRDNFKTKKRKK